MTWPTTDISTTHLDSGGDDPSQARADLKALVDGFNSVRDALGMAALNGFRLSLESGVPVSSSDQTAKTTIYAVPYKGNAIALFDGTEWVVRSSAQFSVALGTITNDRPHDVFCYDNAGVPTLEILAWTSKTARATALSYQDGVLCKNGALTRRYLGTFHTTATTTTEDSARRRLLWNYYHRVRRAMVRQENNASWNYTIATTRQVRADATNQLEIVVGVVEDEISLRSAAQPQNTSTGVLFLSGIGVNSTTVIGSGFGQGASLGASNTSSTANRITPITTSMDLAPALGYSYFAWLEYSAATGTTTWNGVDGAGIAASWPC